MHAQSRAAHGEVKDLPHRGIAQVVSGQSILRLGNLL
jgi:hypothetical protein